MIERTRTIQINPTVVEIVKEFCSMDADQQACFFNEIAIESNKWKRDFCFQLQSIIDSKYLREDGRNIMLLIGEYGEKEND